MDYNYVRMRNARKSGDKALEDRYRKLYEAGLKGAEDTSALNYAIILLIAVAVILGAYILFTEISGNTLTEASLSVYLASACGSVVL